MKNKWKKLLAGVLTISMVVGMLNVSALAHGEDTPQESPTGAVEQVEEQEKIEAGLLGETGEDPEESAGKEPTESVEEKPGEDAGEAKKGFKEDAETEGEPEEGAKEEPSEAEEKEGTGGEEPSTGEPAEKTEESGDGGETEEVHMARKAAAMPEAGNSEAEALVQEFLGAVGKIPDSITGENLEEADTAVQTAWEVYGRVYDLWEKDPSIWAGEVPAAYTRLKAAKDKVEKMKLEAIPFAGEWSEEDGVKVLTITGEGTFTGAFALVENGERIKMVGGLRGKNMPKDPFRVVMTGAEGIGDSVFYQCTTLVGIALNGVSTIGKYAFQECSALTEVDGLEKATAIGNQAFMKAFDPAGDVAITLDGAAVRAYAFNKSNIDRLTATGLTAIGKQAFLGTTVQEVEIGIAAGAELSQDFFYDSAELKALTVTGNLLKKNAFRNCPALERVALNGVTEICDDAFNGCPALQEITGLDGVSHIGIRAFRGAESLTDIVFPASLKTIDYEAFNGAGLTGAIDLSGVEFIAFNAFSNCGGIENITVGENTVLEHSNVFNRIPDLKDRIAKILAGEFVLEPAAEIKTLDPLGWTSGRRGEKNDAENYGGTQITKEARWANGDSTVAEVTIQASYTDVAQMDFVFVLDLSNSMAKVGNTGAGDKNARFYDMQSKLLDVTRELMTTPGYDCRVAFTGFGETSSLSSGKFFDDAGQTAEYITNDLQTYYENTNYSLGLERAGELVKANADRNTTVVFISDGQPYKSGKPVPAEYCGYEAAQAIRDSGVEIYAVLQSIPENELENAQNVMKKICTDGKFFTAGQTREFSTAVNEAIACGFTTYTLVDTVGDDFDLDRSSITVSTGEVAISGDGRTITWTITGMPFMTHTLTFREELKKVEGAYPYGSFDTNGGDAGLTLGEETVNAVATPVLSRSRNTSGGGGDSTAYYTLTVRYVYEDGTEAAAAFGPRSYASGYRYSVASPAIEGYTADILSAEGTLTRNTVITVTYTVLEEELEEPDTPLTEKPAETPKSGETPEPDESPEEELPEEDIPLSELPGDPLPETPAEDAEEDLTDEEIPLADVPQTGDGLWRALWSAMTLVSAAGLVILARTGREEEEGE